MVGIILAFIAFTPRDWFRDQPRIPNASNIAMLPSDHGATAFWIDLAMLSGTPDEQRVEKATALLRTRTGQNRLMVMRVEPIRDSENEIQGYLALARQ